MSEHTSGPWELSRNRGGKTQGIHAKDGNGQRRNIVNWGGLARTATAETQANARLITAAPDLKAFADRIVICVVEGDESKLLLRFDGHLIYSFPANGAAAQGLLRMEGERAAAIAKASPSPSVQEEK